MLGKGTAVRLRQGKMMCRDLLKICIGLFCGYVQGSFVEIYRARLQTYIGLFCGYVQGF